MEESNMENNFYNPFDLSTCEYSKKYYHWCIIKDDKTIVQGKNLSIIVDVKKDLSDKRPVFDSIKVIRTIEPFEDTLR